MKLYEYEGKRVRLTTADGGVFTGEAVDYTSELDNTPEIECISIATSAGTFEALITDIASIELI
jgi:hypothetical protein